MSHRPSSVPPSNDRLTVVVRIENVRPGQTRYVRTLSPGYDGLFTHFVRGQTRYCDPNGCRADYHKMERYWRGYFSAEWFDDARRLWIPCVWELTEHSELDFRGRYARGQSWKVSREEAKLGKHGPVTAELQGALDPLLVPPAFDVRGVLATAFHAPTLRLGEKNPTPPRVILDASPHPTGLRLVKIEDLPRDAAEWERWRKNGPETENGRT